MSQNHKIQTVVELLEIYHYYGGFYYRPLLVRSIIFLEKFLLHEFCCCPMFCETSKIVTPEFRRAPINYSIFNVVFEDIILQLSIICQLHSSKRMSIIKSGKLVGGKVWKYLKNSFIELFHFLLRIFPRKRFFQVSRLNEFFSYILNSFFVNPLLYVGMEVVTEF